MNISRKLVALAIALIMTVLVVAAFLGPLQTERATKADNLRSNDIDEIALAIQNEFDGSQTRVRSLDDVSGANVAQRRLSWYEFDVLSEEQFQLCSNFETDTSSTNINDLYLKNIYTYHTDEGSNPYVHHQGRVCFEFNYDQFGYYDDPMPVEKDDSASSKDDADGGFDFSDINIDALIDNYQ